jgi:PAS domain S-box-containing protein
VTQTAAEWKPWLFALVAALLGLAGQQTIEHYQHQQIAENERRHVYTELSQLRARLEGAITGNLLMVHGLSAVIAANPDIDQGAFARIAGGMVGETNALRNIAGAPDLVIRLMHPMAGNEAALGLDYRQHPVQRDAALRAAESGETVVAGPVALVQGGQALIAREPVFLAADEPGGPRRLWGLVSAVMDMDKLFRLSGIAELQHKERLTIAIRGRDGKGPDGEVFYGDPDLFAQQPELVTISLPGGSWQVAASPSLGWETHAHDRGILVSRTIGLIVSVLLAILSYAVTRNANALRRTAADLRESQRLFTGFMDNLPAGAFVRDARDGRILFENRWLRTQLQDSDFGCGIDSETDLTSLHRGPDLISNELTTADGRQMSCDTLRFLLADGGKHDLVGGIVMDVSERVRAERALAGNRARLRALLDTIPDLVWMKDPEGTFLACNRRVEALFGVPEARIVGRRDDDFVDAQRAAEFRSNDLAAIEAGGPRVNEETIAFASDGHEELVETIKAPVFDHDGELIGVIGIARDITERRAAEQAVRENAERLRAAESIAHIGNWEYRVADGGISWSDETFRIFGLHPGERRPDYAWLLSQIHPDDRAAHDAFLQQMLSARRGERFAERPFRVQRDDGRALVISVHVSIEFDAESRPTRLFGTVQDITEREAMTRNLREQLHELTRWQGVMLGREDRIQELKREVNGLLATLGRPTRYAAQGEDR